MGKSKHLIENINYGKASEFLVNMPPGILKQYFSIFTGGSFDASVIEEWRSAEDKIFSGLLFWFCLDQSIPNVNRLYLAVEPMYDFTYPKGQTEFDNTKWEPSLEKLLIPCQYFIKSIYRNSSKEIENLLKIHTNTDFEKTEYLENKIINDDSIKFKNSFFNQFQTYPFAYFISEEHGNRYFENFFNSGAVKYVRYYFGFDDGDFPNKIRLILVPVDGGGKNINNTSIYSDYLLQKSWPPPPNS